MALTGLSSIVWLPVVGEGITRFAVTLFAAAAWIAVWALGGLERLRPHHRPLYAGLALGIVAVLVASLASRLPALALTFGGNTGLSAPYWVALLVILGASARVTIAGHTLAALRWQFAWAVPVALVGIAQAAMGRETTFAYENADLFAPMMLMFVPLALGFSAISPKRRWLWRAVAGLFVTAVLAARTLSGLVGLCAMAFFLLVFAPGLVGMSGRVRYAFASLLLAGLIGFMAFGTLYLTDALPAPVERWVVGTDFGRSAATRVEMWRAGIREIRDHLLVGVGPDQYSYAGQHYFTRELHVLEHYPYPDVELPPDPHSLIILLPVDFGLLGSAAALLIAIAWARGVLRPAFGSPEGRLVCWSFALAALGFGYSTLFTPFPLHFGGLPLLITGLAVVRAPERRPWPPEARYAAPRGAAAAIALLLAVALGGASILGRAWFVAGLRDPSATGALERAVLLQPQIGFYRFALLQRRGLLLERAGPGAVKEYQAAVDEAGPSVRGYAPYLVELVRLSTLDARRTGRKDLSWERARLTEALRLSPELPEATLELAHVAIVEGRLDEAERLLARTAAWKDRIPEHGEYELLLRAFRQREGAPLAD